MIVDVVVFMVAAVFVAVVLTDGCLRRPCRSQGEFFTIKPFQT